MGICTTHEVAGLSIEFLTGFSSYSLIALDMDDEKLKGAVDAKDSKLFDALAWAIEHYDDIHQANYALYLAQSQSEPFKDADTQKLKEWLQNPFLNPQAIKALKLELEIKTARAENIANSRNVPPELREAVLARNNHVCQYCGGEADCADHVFPFSRGGRTVMDNLVAACGPCNCKKNSRTPEEAGMAIHEQQ